MAPAMTSTSLLASAIVLRNSIAARTASNASVPLDAHSTTSASGCDATATRPSRPLAAMLTSPTIVDWRRRSIAAPTARALRPIEPVDPRMAMRFKADLSYVLEDDVVHRRREQQRIDPIQDP